VDRNQSKTSPKGDRFLKITDGREEAEGLGQGVKAGGGDLSEVAPGPLALDPGELGGEITDAGLHGAEHVVVERVPFDGAAVVEGEPAMAAPVHAGASRHPQRAGDAVIAETLGATRDALRAWFPGVSQKRIITFMIRYLPGKARSRGIGNLFSRCTTFGFATR
jgi:hypothetical protein